MTAVTWGARALIAALVIVWILIGAGAVRDWWRKRHPAGSKIPGPDHPQASGVSGLSDTGVMDIDAEYRALLDKEAGRG